MKVGTEFNCGNCNVKVVFDGNGKKFCSRKCYIEKRIEVRETRICKTCGEEKKLDEENFLKHKGLFMHRCKPCQQELRRECIKKAYDAGVHLKSDEKHRQKNYGLTAKQKSHIKRKFGLDIEKY